MQRNLQYKGHLSTPALYDITSTGQKELIVFVHGYMGFKDWGAWELVHEFFVTNGWDFARFNMTHNGTTLNSPKIFEDLERFSKNTYSIELGDLEKFIEEMHRLYQYEKVHLIGHSRGGGIALLASTHPFVKSITSWAGISSIQDRFGDSSALEDWKRNGVRYTINGRTNQKMPHLYEQYEDYINNKVRLSIENQCKQLDKPVFLVHGDMDTSVSILEGKRLAEWMNQDLFIVPNANHTFGSSEPLKEQKLPNDLKICAEKTLEFINNL